MIDVHTGWLETGGAYDVLISGEGSYTLFDETIDPDGAWSASGAASGAGSGSGGSPTTFTTTRQVTSDSTQTVDVSVDKTGSGSAGGSGSGTGSGSGGASGPSILIDIFEKETHTHDETLSGPVTFGPVRQTYTSDTEEHGVPGGDVVNTSHVFSDETETANGSGGGTTVTSSGMNMPGQYNLTEGGLDLHNGVAGYAAPSGHTTAALGTEAYNPSDGDAPLPRGGPGSLSAAADGANNGAKQVAAAPSNNNPQGPNEASPMLTSAAEGVAGFFGIPKRIARATVNAVSDMAQPLVDEVKDLAADVAGDMKENPAAAVAVATNPIAAGAYFAHKVDERYGEEIAKAAEQVEETVEEVGEAAGEAWDQFWGQTDYYDLHEGADIEAPSGDWVGAFVGEASIERNGITRTAEEVSAQDHAVPTMTPADWDEWFAEAVPEEVVDDPPPPVPDPLDEPPGFWDDPLDWAFGGGGQEAHIADMNGDPIAGFMGGWIRDLVGDEYLLEASGWELVGVTSAASTAIVVTSLYGVPAAVGQATSTWAALGASKIALLPPVQVGAVQLATGGTVAVTIPAVTVTGQQAVVAAVGITLLLSEYTEPTLPTRTIVNENGVTVEHYYHGGDHGPPHAHVHGQGPRTRIGQNGKPLKGDLELSPAQEKVIQSNLSTIRGAIGKISKWLRFKRYFE